MKDELLRKHFKYSVRTSNENCLGLTALLVGVIFFVSSEVIIKLVFGVYFFFVFGFLLASIFKTVKLRHELEFLGEL